MPYVIIFISIDTGISLNLFESIKTIDLNNHLLKLYNMCG